MRLPARMPALIGLGITQILGWGTLYYSLAIWAQAVQQQLGLSEWQVFGGFSLGLIASGLTAPLAGRWIDKFGGRIPLTIGSIVAALAFVLLGMSQGIVTYTLAWIVAGVAMSLCLYDPAFSVMHQLTPERYRQSITIITLFGGFASTVFWPLTHELLERFSWRETLLVFALLHLFSAPLLFWILKGARSQPTKLEDEKQAQPIDAKTSTRRAIFWLALAFASVNAIFAILSLFIIEAIQLAGFTTTEAVALAALIGPLQVFGRIIEWLFGARFSAVAVGALMFCMMFTAMVLLNVLPHNWAVAVVCVGFYGVANGVLTVLRGAIPVELFGGANVGNILGKLARPAFIAKAAAPVGFSLLLSNGVALPLALWVLVVLAVASVLFFVPIGLAKYRP